MKGIIAFPAMAALALSAMAVNPVISERYTPDPAPYVHNDTLYLFVDHDEPEDIGYFNMKDWLLYSTTDMVNWTYRGTPVTTATFSGWAKQDNDAWASQCVERDGKWYWYVTATVEGKGYPGIGVAVADNPAGPYTDALGKPIAQGWFYIDPTVFIDDDGQAYLFWGNNGLWYGKLSKNMKRLGAITQVNTLDTKAFGPYKGYDDNGNPKTNYEEAPWLYKKDGTYYLEYAAGGVPEHWAYSTAESIDGPWTYRGKVMGVPDGSFTIHGGSVSYKGHDYMFYHDGRLPGGGGFRRSTSIEEFRRNADGSLPFIPFTTEGVSQIGYLDAFSWQEAETINESSKVLCVGDGALNYVTDIKSGGYTKVKGVDFGAEETMKLRVRVASDYAAKINVRIDSRTGPTIAQVEIPATGGLDKWQEIEVDVTDAPVATHDLYFIFSGRQRGDTMCNFDKWIFIAPTGIADIECDADAPTPLYNLDGTPHTADLPRPSVVVTKGRKFLER